MPTEDQLKWAMAERHALGRRIQGAREQANIRQEALAHKVGVDRRTVQRIEAGSGNATITTLLLIARALGEPLADLLAERT
ncbi:helix-turn-helix transcriptional regulator [Streptantibioticus silvisoli]|uniref:Helix-turn-helix transcriptional regulator n=1 Tax=Streptantibioticus silvisoli TaxID=2705255 RepID=A0ABT6W4M3_9ACTN|nr:helix-turn-helix transcriptional regulator [Streptantibioticus silvisoli]MDI5965690.1 helix-turn-helix transcriptional regulator [Streptantibioticus silvisoli]